jgi:TonB family protein
MGYTPENRPAPATSPSVVDAKESHWTDTQPFDLSRLVSTLAAHGGGPISNDLALDLVLNEVVKHACLVTGASAAAIALVRENEMVCRATTGAEAPDLGVRLDTRTGLSGACVLTRELQHCNDTESDPRVNLEVSRRLGVRSVLVVPLLDGKELVGIFEIFSPEANHFGEPDILTVRSLAKEVIHNLRRVSGADSETQVGEPEEAPALAPVVEAPHLQQQVSVDKTERVQVEARTRANELWTTVLSVMVVAAAIFLGTLVGWRLGWQKAIRRASSRTKNVAVKPIASQPASASSGASTSGANTNRSPETLSSLPANPVAVQEAGSASNAKAGAATVASNVSSLPPAGGLVVYQNGKVIYRMGPTKALSGAPSIQQPTRTSQVSREVAGSPAPSGTAVRQVSEEVAAARLIHRTEPDYPSQARAQGIQGAVVLDARIDREGKVQDLALISGDPLLVDAAMKAVRQWQYQPFSEGGQAAEVRTQIVVKFSVPKD